jgi:hypothetical protein
MSVRMAIDKSVGRETGSSVGRVLIIERTGNNPECTNVKRLES